MLYFAHRLINEERASDIARRLMISNEWVDGKASAKQSQVKKNLQLNLGDTHTKLSQEIIELMLTTFLSNLKYLIFYLQERGEGCSMDLT
jgi:predicted 2-oxoglutarate/Fe(II)-dependent dioxygenase YbiX